METLLLSAIEPLSLQGNVKLAAAIIFGIFLGMLLIKCDFAERELVKKNLTFSSMKMSKTLLLSLAVGMVLFLLLRNSHIVQHHWPASDCWGVWLGGVLVGIGLGIGGLVPVTAVAALASGRLYAIWMIAGMLLAFPAVKFCKQLFPGLTDKFSAPVNISLETTGKIFTFDNPVLWISAIALLLCLIMHFLGARDSE